MIETTKFNHGIASYPKEWRDLVVSENKICIQFNTVQCKTRVTRDFKEELNQFEYGYTMPVYSHGTDIPFLAVGIPLKLHKTMLLELLRAYKEHADKYENNLKEFLLDYSNKIQETFNG